MKKYLVFQNEVVSKSDGDIHFISAIKLMELYNVKPKNCIIIRTEQDRIVHNHDIHNSKLIKLFPKFNGDYSIPRLV